MKTTMKTQTQEKKEWYLMGRNGIAGPMTLTEADSQILDAARFTLHTPIRVNESVLTPGQKRQAAPVYPAR